MSSPFPASPLAFGTGSLMGRLTGRESTRLLQVALDEGVRHFDTARLYSDGESERLLGSVLRNRDDVTIGTKVGLGRSTFSNLTTARNAVLRRGVAAARRLRRGTLGRPATVSSTPQADLGPRFVLESIETSRRLLRRDTLDCVLLHEVAADQVGPALTDLLATIVDRGLARRVGVATRSSELRAMIAVGPPPGTVVQLPGGPLIEPVRVPPGRIELVHSLFGAGGELLGAFVEWLRSHPDRERVLSAALGAPLDRDALGPALLRAARVAEPDRTVIVSSRSEAHLRELCRAVERGGGDEVALVLEASAAFRAERRS